MLYNNIISMTLVLMYTFKSRTCVKIGSITVNSSIDSFRTASRGIIGVVPELVEDSQGDLPVLQRIPVPDLIKKEGYPAESHYITTKDGYILNIHRIPYGKKSNSSGKVVYLQHGLLAASSDWVLFGPKQGLAYILADAGYDVWMGNTRGNLYSRNHTRLTTKDVKFWDFSWHEIGTIDVPTTIDYILAITGQDKLFHIGHSQGTTTFYVMASERPEYNSKIRAHISLAPVAFMNHIFSPLLRIMAFGVLPIEMLLKWDGQYEFLPKSGFLKFITDVLCSHGLGKVLCKNIIFGLNGYSPKQMKASAIPLIMAHYPAGASTKQVAHYGQEINSGRFRQYDYYTYGNLKKYGRTTPPDYNLTKISASVHLLYSTNDWMAAPIDVQKLYSLLPNCKELYKVSIDTWNHLDFIFGYDAPVVVYRKILDILHLY